MKFQLPANVLGTEGGFYEGTFKGTLCFVPHSLIRNGQLDEGRYVAQGWASLNIKAQQPRGGIGSHLFPNLSKPVSDAERCERLKTRIDELRQPVGRVTTQRPVLLQGLHDDPVQVAPQQVDKLGRAGTTALGDRGPLGIS